MSLRSSAVQPWTEWQYTGSRQTIVSKKANVARRSVLHASNSSDFGAPEPTVADRIEDGTLDTGLLSEEALRFRPGKRTVDQPVIDTLQLPPFSCFKLGL